MRNELTRANRIAVETKDGKFVGRFYRTHKMLVEINDAQTDWTPNEESNATQNRKAFRIYLTEHAEEFGILWHPAKAEQAWERKHNIYMNDEQVSEDAITLLRPSIERLADKCRYDMMIVSTEVTAVTPKESTLSYVENGRYTKSGAWCVADIEVTVGTIINGKAVAILYGMEMKSGQICKPKTTIAEWNEIVTRELDLQGIVIEEVEVA